MPAVNYGSGRTGKCLILLSVLPKQQRQAVEPRALAGYVDILHNSLAGILPSWHKSQPLRKSEYPSPTDTVISIILAPVLDFLSY